MADEPHKPEVYDFGTTMTYLSIAALIASAVLGGIFAITPAN
jgi:hypothetical protein